MPAASQVRPLSASSALRRPPSATRRPASATGTPLRAPSFAKGGGGSNPRLQRAGSSMLMVQDPRLETAILEQRLAIRQWSPEDVRNTLSDLPFFRDTLIPRPVLGDGDFVVPYSEMAPAVRRSDLGSATAVPLFEALFLHRIDGPGLLELSEDDVMKRLGVRQLGTAKAIVRNVRGVEMDAAERSIQASSGGGTREPSVLVTPSIDRQFSVSGSPLVKTFAASTGSSTTPLPRARPATASLRPSPSVLDPFADEQSRYCADLNARASRRVSSAKTRTLFGATPAAADRRGDASAAASAADAQFVYDDDDDDGGGDDDVGADSRTIATMSSVAARPSSATARIAELLARSREKRGGASRPATAEPRSGAWAAGTQSAAAAVSANLATTARLEGLVAPGGLASTSPALQSAVADFIGASPKAAGITAASAEPPRPALQLPTTATVTTLTKDAETAGSPATETATAEAATPPVTTSQPMIAAQPQREGVEAAAKESEAASTEEPPPRETVGILEAQRRIDVFGHVFDDVAEGTADGKVRLAVVIDTCGEFFDWDTTAVKISTQQSYQRVRSARAQRKRRTLQQHAASGDGGLIATRGSPKTAQIAAAEGDDDDAAMPGAQLGGYQGMSDEAIAKNQRLPVSRDEFVELCTSFTLASTRREVDHLEALFSNKYGEKQREAARRFREAGALFRAWDVYGRGLLPLRVIEDVIKATAEECAGLDPDPISVPTINFGSSLSAVRSRSASPQQRSIAGRSPDQAAAERRSTTTADDHDDDAARSASAMIAADDVTMPEWQDALCAAWGAIPGDIFDDVFLVLRRRVQGLAAEALGHDRVMMSAAEMQAVVEAELSVSTPVLITHCASKSPTVLLDTVCRNLAPHRARPGPATMVRVGVGSKKSEEHAMTCIRGAGMRDGRWVALEFPLEASVADPPPIPPGLAGQLQEEATDKEMAAAAAASLATSRRSSIASVASTGAESAAAVDDYTGMRFTGAMLRCLRGIGLLLSTSPTVDRHPDFRLFVHVPTDFAGKDIEVPSILRLHAAITPLLRDPRPERAGSPIPQVTPRRLRISDGDDATDKDAREAVDASAVSSRPPSSSARPLSSLRVSSPTRRPSRLQRALDAASRSGILTAEALEDGNTAFRDAHEGDDTNASFHTQDAVHMAAGIVDSSLANEAVKMEQHDGSQV